MANHVLAQGAPNSFIRFLQENPGRAFDLFVATQKGDVRAQEAIMLRIIDLAVKQGYQVP